MRIHPPARRLTAVALASGALLLTPAAAHADDELSLSLDGATWTPDITAPLFDPAMRWVPGDVETATFFVRNNAPQGARLDVTLRPDGQESLLDDGWVSVVVRTPAREGEATTGPGPSTVLVDAPVPGSQVVPVEVEVTFDEDAPNGTRLRSASLGFDVVLTQTQEIGGGSEEDPDGPDGPDDSDGSDGGTDGGADGGTDGGAGTGTGGVAGSDGGSTSDRGGLLPDTGSLTPSWLLAAAALALGLGAGLSTRTRLARPHTRQDTP